MHCAKREEKKKRNTMTDTSPNRNRCWISTTLFPNSRNVSPFLAIQESFEIINQRKKKKRKKGTNSKTRLKSKKSKEEEEEKRKRRRGKVKKEEKKEEYQGEKTR